MLKELSGGAKSLIASLLCHDAERRLTAKAALGHSFLKQARKEAAPGVRPQAASEPSAQAAGEAEAEEATAPEELESSGLFANLGVRI